MKSEAIQELKSKIQESIRAKYPNLPTHAIPTPAISDNSANSLTKAILKWLELNGHKGWRQSSEGRFRPGQSVVDVIGRTRIMKGQYLPGQNKGHSDVQSIINGLFCCFEVKMKDRQSEAQKRFQQEVEASGGKYYIVRSFDEFMKYYRQLINKGTL